jgi:hypothetical protein
MNTLKAQTFAPSVEAKAMKTSKELAEEYWKLPQAQRGFIPWIRRVRLEGIKEGMRRAAKIKVPPAPIARLHEAREQAILIAAEQLTEKDIP